MTQQPGSRLPRLGATCAAALLAGSLAACSGSAPPPPLAGDTPADPPPSRSTTPTPTPTARAAETPEQATAIATQVIAASVAAVQQPGPEGQAARGAVFAGDALTAANAEHQLLATLTPEQQEAKVLTDAPPTVLAISRGADYPRALLTRTTRRSSGFPVVTLLVAPDVPRGYQVAASASLLPNTSVGDFDLLTAGSPWTRDVQAVGNNAEAIVTEYARALAYPAPASGDLPFTSDSFAASLRQGAEAQAQALGPGATVTMSHTVKGVPGAFAQRGQGDWLVFVVLEGTDTFQEDTPNAITPSPQFAALSGTDTIDTEGRQQRLDFLLFQVPRTGKASVVAASEQLYAASGS